jgi:hypothetical protein
MRRNRLSFLDEDVSSALDPSLAFQKIIEEEQSIIIFRDLYSFENEKRLVHPFEPLS